MLSEIKILLALPFSVAICSVQIHHIPMRMASSSFYLSEVKLMHKIIFVPWYRITIKNIRGEFVAFGLFASRAACVGWYKGYMYGLNPNNNESDFYPYSIEEVYNEV